MATFDHYFEPANVSTLGPTVDIATRDIEDAGIREVLQTPGAALGSWAILGALLVPGTDFTLREPLGRSREVKTALSGLFGRFVARAYAERHLNLIHFAHITSGEMLLDHSSGAVVRRRPDHFGDLPDWAAWSPNDEFAIVEAKGCHNRASDTLNRAYRQAERVEIAVGGKPAPFKRYAIVSRWQVASSRPSRSAIRVRDPDVEAEPLREDERAAIGIGIARRHCAALLRSLGHSELSAALLELADKGFKNKREGARQRARDLIDRSVGIEVRSKSRRGPITPLIGGIVTRGGPLGDAGRTSNLDRETLTRLDLNPTFVGIERRMLSAVVEGDAKAVLEETIEETLADPTDRTMGPTTDRGGGWIVRLADDETELG